MLALAPLVMMSSSTVSAQDDQQANVLEEVVVTARRTQESLQDTPIAVTALNEDAIAIRNMQSVAEVTNFAPNVQFDSAASESGGGSSSQIYIRGIGQTDYTITVEPGVGLYLDGVYIGKSVGSLMDAVDLEGIEVLRGPQGTLFGRNTIGGAILLRSKKPSDEHEFDLQYTVGEFDRRDIKVSGNIPVSDSFRVRGSVAYLDRDGHVDRILTGSTQGDKDALTGRVVADWDFTDSFTGTFAFDGTRSREQSPGQVTVAVDENAFFAGLHNTIRAPECDPALADPARFSNPNCANSQFARDIDDLESTNTGPNQSDTDVFGFSATFDWDLESASLKSITAYRDAEVDVFQELVGAPTYQNDIGQDIELELFSQEFQITGEAFDSKLNYIGGLYFSSEKGSQVFPVLLEAAQFTSGGEIDNESFAVFGQIGFAITDKLNLSVGGRYTEETRRYLPIQNVDNVADDYEGFFEFLAGATGNGFLVQEGLALFPEVEVKRKDDDFTPSVILDYEINETVFGYLSYSEGYKGGGFTMRGFPPVVPGVTTTETDINQLIPSFGPESAKVVEAGVKAELFDRRVRINTAVFYTDYEDVQLTANTGPSAFVPVLINAGDVEIKGIEVEADILAANWLRVNLGLGFIDAEYDSLSDAAIGAGTTLDSEIPNTPEFTASLGATVDFFDNENGHMYGRVDLSHKSSQFKTVANEPILKQDSYTLLNAALSYQLPNEKLGATLGVTNLTDEIYIVSGVFNGGIGYAQAVVSRPREWFLTLKYSLN